MSENNERWVTKSEIASLIGKSEKTVERFLNAHPQLKEFRVKRERSFYYPLIEVQKCVSKYLHSASPEETVTPETNTKDTTVAEIKNIQDESVKKDKEAESEIKKLQELVQKRNSFLRWVLTGNFFDGAEVEGSFGWYANPKNENYSDFIKVLSDIGVEVNDIINKHFNSASVPLSEEQVIIDKINHCHSFYDENIQMDFQRLSKVLNAKLIKMRREKMGREINRLQARIQWVQWVVDGHFEKINAKTRKEITSIFNSMGLDANRLLDKIFCFDAEHFDKTRSEDSF